MSAKANVVTNYIRGFSTPFAVMAKCFTIFWFLIKTRFKSGRIGKQIRTEETVKQLFFTGVMSVRLVTLLGILIGIMGGFQLSILVGSLGEPQIANRTFYNIIVREFAPLVAACVVIARSASAISVELSTLVVNEELDVFKSQGIDWVSVLLYPRFVAVVTSVVMLSAFAAIISLFAGIFLVHLRSNLPFNLYLQHIIAQGQFKDAIVLVVKGIVNGSFIALLSFYFGLSIKPSLTQVPHVASKVVVNCLVSVLILSILISVIAYR